MNLASGYAYALYELRKNKNLSSEEVVSKLIGTLKSKGHVKLLPQIINEFEKITDKGRDKVTTTLACAREKDFVKYRNKLEEYSTDGDTGFTEEIVDDTLIGGFVIQKDDVIVDGSYKKKLLLIYRNATA